MAPGWYYEFEGDEPEGPYPTQLAAGKAARDVILDVGRSIARVGDRAVINIGPGPSESSLRGTIASPGGCPGRDNCWARPDEARNGIMPDRCTTCPDRPEAAASNRRAMERRSTADDHFAGRDRRMRERRGDESATGRQGQVRTLVAGEPVWRDLAVPGDHRLDRIEGRNKYAVINMREVMAIDDGIDGTSTRGAQVINAMNTLRHHGVLNDGDPKTKGEFFVLMLKDQFADLALLAYAGAARKAGMHEYADDILQLAVRAGHGHPHCKVPD